MRKIDRIKKLTRGTELFTEGQSLAHIVAGFHCLVKSVPGLSTSFLSQVEPETSAQAAAVRDSGSVTVRSIRPVGANIVPVGPGLPRILVDFLPDPSH